MMFSFAGRGNSIGSTSKALLGCIDNLTAKNLTQNRNILPRPIFLPSSCNRVLCVKYTTLIRPSFEDPKLLFLKFQKYNNLTGFMEKPSDKYSSSSSENKGSSDEVQLSNKDKLKRAVKDYGATVIVFHVTISLMSLGISYLAISSGVDVASLLSRLGFSSSSDIAAGASTFVVAYAVHKMFAPVRISITLGSTPFIVRYLRKVGFLKPPKTQS